jgi:hypothetical protein
MMADDTTCQRADQQAGTSTDEGVRSAISGQAAD